jgi:hypothetical protein
LNVLRSLYPKHGSIGVHESLPHKTTAAIRAQAARLGIKSHCPPKQKTDEAWAVPTMTLLEQLDCVVLRKWRGPVNAGPLVGSPEWREVA